MRVVLDTHILLWALSDPQRLSEKAQATIRAAENDVLFSAASIWEIAIKSQLGRNGFGIEPDTIVEAARESGFEELPVHSHAAACVAKLPLYHRDPFDRLLIAQAIVEPARLLTNDRTLSRYCDLVMLM